MFSVISNDSNKNGCKFNASDILKLVRKPYFHGQASLFYPLNLKIFFSNTAANKKQSFADAPSRDSVACFGHFCTKFFSFKCNIQMDLEI